MLGVLNLLLILVIITVIIINIVVTHRKISSIENSLSSRNVLDLAEFRKIDKEFKRNYEKYFVNGIMPPVVDQLNKDIADSGINTYIKNNKEEIKRSIDTLPYALYYDSINDSSKKETKAEPTTKEKFMSYNIL